MISGKSVVAVITARAGSKGLPGKNIMPLAGKPLLAWPVEAALGSQFVDSVVVSTDSEAYAALARDCGATVPYLRPESLAQDTASSIDVVLHMLAQLQQQGQSFDYVVLLEPTSPLTESSDIDAALTQLLAQRQQGMQAIVGVAQEESAHPEFLVTLGDNEQLIPFTHAEAPLTSTQETSQAYSSSGKRRQDLSKVYKFEGSLYVSCVPALKQKRGFYHDATLGYVVPKWKAFEIDDLIDFKCVEAIVENLEQIKHDNL